ncbi:glycosyltransferase family 4 protein [Haloarchaeobius sp. TZWSO28]|uniref:glycosyltransferase family 4 protein n=1 Tax=Haloarchaeobius sp. TZWSO28 TaxID=3446119 RepID=UPI003EBCEF64
MSNPKSVLLTTDYLPPSSGGVERVVTELALGLADEGVEVTVLALESGNGELAESDVRVIDVPSLNLTKLLGVQAQISPLFPFVLWWVIRRFQPDVVHAHNRFFFSTWSSAVVLGLCPSSPPLVTTVHLGDISDISGSAGIAARVIEETFGRLVFGTSTAVIGVSKAALHAVSHLTSGSGTTVYNGVDTDKFQVAGGDSSGKETTILFVGRLIENKGILRLLEAVIDLDRDASWRLLIVGTGPMAEQCRTFVDQHDLGDRVDFRGFVESVPAVMAEADVFCRPSDTEGLPLTLLEAMAAGLCPVVTPAGGVKEVIDSGQNGVIVECEASNIAAALERLMEEPTERTRLATNARTTVVSKYSWESRIQPVMSVYKECLN